MSLDRDPAEAAVSSMNQQPAGHRWGGSSRKFLTIAILIALVLSGVLYFILTPSSASKLRADLKKRGFKLTLSELAASQSAASKSIDEFIQLNNDIERLTSLRPEWPFPLMSLQPSAALIPVIKKEKPFCDTINTNYCNWTWDDLAAALQQAEPALARLRTLARQDVSVYWQGTNSRVFDLINEGRWLSLDAVSALRGGATTRALEDVEAILGLAMIGADEKSHIIQIGRLADMRFALKTSWEILQSTDLTEPELRQMAAAWERIAPLKAAEFAAEGELVWAAEMAPEMRKELAQASLHERLLGVVTARICSIPLELMVWITAGTTRSLAISPFGTRATWFGPAAANYLEFLIARLRALAVSGTSKQTRAQPINEPNLTL